MENRLRDLTIPTNYTLQKTGITQSLLSTFLTCRVMFLLSLNKYYIPTQSKALHFGNLIHAMLEQYYTTGKYSIDKWKDDEIRLDAQEVERQKAVATPLLKIYKRVYPKETFKSVEETFQFDFNGFKLNIKIDGVTDDLTYLIDHKTSSKINEEDLMDKLSFDFQSLFYIIAMETEDNSFKGAYNNVIRRPEHKQKDLSLKDFQKRIENEIIKNPDHFYKRFKIPFTKGEKKRYADELKYKLDEVQMVLEGRLHIFKSEGHCITGWGACKFLKVCASGNLSFCKRRKKLFPELNL